MFLITFLWSVILDHVGRRFALWLFFLHFFRVKSFLVFLFPSCPFVILAKNPLVFVTLKFLFVYFFFGGGGGRGRQMGVNVMVITSRLGEA